ncbi:hypothetical protein J2X47_002972 [Sphingomonas sp. BE270]|jgi:hypothetical protein|uniref:hypothetical protein n=2 Tax=Sphingomonas TaxID=13687 RepID=UPI00053E6CA9|nr:MULTISPECIES: hypothetical protein [unclassified Sphingomonas]MDR6849597.1 hypothetical protein [Sphingomonas sp. BE137]MDR7258782.1 hypothetical protein [Sphingomonas sp. BE270]
MASLAEPHSAVAKDDRFFFITSLIMAAIVVAGFSLMIVTGRSSFASPPIVHAHAVVFMGWVVLYVTQNALVARGSIALHRRLGWIGAGWIVAMVVLGTIVTVRLVRLGHAPFFFPPALFLVLNPVTILTFAALTTAAIVRRRQTEWHRRLHFSGMALLLGPAYGRLLPMPFLIPYAYEVDVLAVLILPIVGMVFDLRRTGKVHPAWWWGLAAIIGSTVLSEAITYSPLGTALYRAATAGSPGASVAPLAYPPFPPLS